MQGALAAAKEIMTKFEEKNHENKEERMIFGEIMEEKTRIVGVWMGSTEDLKQRKARAGRAWFKVKSQLK